MIRLENIYSVKKRYPDRFRWPDHDYWMVARKLGNMADRLEKAAQRETLYDPYMNEWIIACLDAFCAGAYDFIMHIDPDNSHNYAHWRADHKITLPTKQSVPIHFAYVPFNVKNALRYGEEHYKSHIIPTKNSQAKYRRLTKYHLNRAIAWREADSWEYFGKFWKKEFERTGRAKKWYGIYKAPFSDKEKVAEDRFRLNKVYANYIVCLVMCAKELKERFMAGEFLDTSWKMKLIPGVA